MSEIDGHDIIVHVITLADGEVSLVGLFHAHVLVKAQRGILAVDVELHGAGFRMQFLDGFQCLFEQHAAQMASLVGCQNVDFLEMEGISPS